MGINSAQVYEMVTDAFAIRRKPKRTYIKPEQYSKEAQQAKIAKAQEKRERRMARNRRNGL